MDEKDVPLSHDECTWSEASLAERERIYEIRFSHATQYGLLLAPGSDNSSWSHLLREDLFYVFVCVFVFVFIFSALM